MKKRILLLFAILFLFSVQFSLAFISDTIRLGETNQYFSKDMAFNITFQRFDILTERAIFKIGNTENSLLAGSKKNFSGNELTFIGTSGDSIPDFKAEIQIEGFNPIACESHCLNNTFVGIMSFFDSDFKMCQKNCSEGCSLLNKKICKGNESWLVNNCNKDISLIEKCKNCFSGECTDCENGKCIKKYDYCIADSDCQTGRCYLGECIKKETTNFCPKNICLPGCTCKDAKNEGKDGLPIIIVHGFSSSPEKMKELQKYLSFDLGYENGGEITLDANCPSLEKKTVYLVTYYADQGSVNKISDFVQTTLNRLGGNAKQGSYVHILSRMVDKVKSCSDSDQVNIVAHSMGGLVVNNYINDGANAKNVNKLIILGTPFHGGIYGTQNYKLFKGIENTLGDRKNLLKDCASIGLPSVVLSFLDGRDVTNDCQSLDSLNSNSNQVSDETPGDIEYYTIAGDIDGKGDGTVSKESVALKGSVFNEVVECEHFDLKNPSRCEESYNKILQSLGYSSDDLQKKSMLRTISDEFISWIDYANGWFE